MMLRAQEALLSQEALPRPGRSPRRADTLLPDSVSLPSPTPASVPTLWLQLGLQPGLSPARHFLPFLRKSHSANSTRSDRFRKIS